MIFPDYADKRYEKYRIHEYSLPPAKQAWRESRELAECQTAGKREKRKSKNKIISVAIDAVSDVLAHLSFVPRAHRFSKHNKYHSIIL